MDWNFKNDQYTLKTKEEMQVTIALISVADYTTIKEIPQKDVCEGSRNLGAMLAPQGNNQDEFKKLIHTGKTMSMNISTSKLLRHEVLLAYASTSHEVSIMQLHIFY